MRLEARLHDALTDRHAGVTVAVVPEQIHSNSDSDSGKNDHEERKAELAAQEHLDVKERVLREKETELNDLARAMERSFAARAVEVESLARQARQERERSLLAQEDAAMWTTSLDAMQTAHAQERERLESLSVYLEETEAALETRKHNLALFAHEVECQHQSNVALQRRLDAEVQKVRSHTSGMRDLRGGDGDDGTAREQSSTLRRSLTSSLFQAK
uniref:Uncharacterized protein n=1 Tax=Globisporangium ultimum (strain ATCC 200006 / CBS 805.95 / DAOM BR144) TaxID=431595 RepID=K3WBF2_GLOUD